MKKLCAFALGLAAFGSVLADDLAATVKVGTLGAGLEVVKGLSPNFNGRFGANAFNLKRGLTESDIRYDAELDFRTFSAMLDWHPGGGAFRATVGAVRNGNKLTLTAKPTQAIVIGNQTFQPSDVGQLDGRVEFESFSPYLGIGWGNAVDKSKTWGFSLDIGVMAQSPSASLTAQCKSSVTQVCTELSKAAEAERKDLQDALKDFKVYPVIAFGLTYRF
jgi:hypothetical protein